MKKDGITIMLLGLGITIIIAIFYFTRQNDLLMNKFVINFGKAFHFNWAPMIGIVTMAFGEFILWKSQNNKNLNEVMIKVVNNYKLKITNIKLEIICLSNKNLNNMRELKVLLLSFKL